MKISRAMILVNLKLSNNYMKAIFSKQRVENLKFKIALLRADKELRDILFKSLIALTPFKKNKLNCRYEK